MSWIDMLEMILTPTTLVEVPYRKRRKRGKRVTK